MGQQIKFFNINRLDLSNTNSTITVTDTVATNNGQSFVDFIRNRNNVSAWLTTGSTDAANTTLVADFGEEREITDIILIGHNFKAYTIKYWDGASYINFSTVISETVNADVETNYEFTQVSTSKIQIIITAAMVVDADKVLKQLIATDKLATGQLVGWPIIRNPRFNTNQKINNMLSGKVNVVDSVGGFSMTLSVSNWNIDADLTIVEEIYFGKRGVLVWPCGGDESQFSHLRIGYRRQDIYFMRATNSFKPTWKSGVYVNGIKMDLKLSEAVA